jgi:hypothetical protein
MLIAEKPILLFPFLKYKRVKVKAINWYQLQLAATPTPLL